MFYCYLNMKKQSHQRFKETGVVCLPYLSCQTQKQKIVKECQYVNQNNHFVRLFITHESVCNLASTEEACSGKA